VRDAKIKERVGPHHHKVPVSEIEETEEREREDEPGAG